MSVRILGSKVLYSGTEIDLSPSMAGMFIGEPIGEGVYRRVYQDRLSSDFIIKVEKHGWTFQNVFEHDIWDRVKNTEFAKYFCPVTTISSCGKILMMERALPLQPGQMLKEIPAFFTDVHEKNWGLLKGRPVCIDYGANLLIEKGLTKRMQKVKWA